MSVAYDAGVLVAADRSERRVWAEHRALLEAGVVPATTAPVVAQASRSPQQAQLRRFLHGCEILPFPAAAAHQVGALLEATGHDGVVDAHLILAASQLEAIVITSDPDDLRILSAALPRPVRVRPL